MSDLGVAARAVVLVALAPALAAARPARTAEQYVSAHHHQGRT
ncbi:hypothetical protein OG216_38610 [Streptomycetaceae bacterium NBC_01309]